MNFKIREIVEILNKWGVFAFKSLISKKNLKRDIVLLIPYLVVLGFFIDNTKLQNSQPEKVAGEADVVLSEEQVFEEVKMVQETLDLTNWKTHQSQWYGVEVKYPQNWLAPKNQGVSGGAAWEYRYQFRKKTVEGNNPYAGFDLVIYNLSRVKDIFGTVEFPTIKNEELKKEGKCEDIAGHLIETGDYPAEEIYISPTDDCFNPTLPFSFTKDQYIYNIVPVFSDKAGIIGDMQTEVVDNFPEFFGVVSTFKIIDIVRPRPVVKPRISAPKPVAAVNGSGYGKMTCAKKNDNPSKSNKNKGKHLDMECCLDPDEYPNPWCDYSSSKYQKYLK